jgi:predicted PurR-regulated permease PerM
MTPEPAAQSSARAALIGVGLLIAAWMLWSLRSVLLLVGFAALLAFALDPLVAMLERLKTPWGRVRRPVAAAVVMVCLVAAGGWVLISVLPRLASELAHFVEGAPASLDRLLLGVRVFAVERGMGAWLGPLGGDSPMDAAEILRRSGGALMSAVGSLFGSIGHLIGLALVPMLAFYLLAEREAVEVSALGFVPEEARPRAQQVIQAIDRALRSYVRGQAVVCATMGILVAILLALLGLPVPALLGTVVALAEVIPILGFWTASLAVVLAGWGARPELALYGWLAYLIVNQVVNVLVTPRVMGRHMKLHPFVVTVSILAGGALLGAAGAVLALPLAATIQSVVSEFAPRRVPDAAAPAHGTTES